LTQPGAFALDVSSLISRCDPGLASAAGRHARLIQELFDHAGVRINGSQPYDPQIRNPRGYRAMLAKWTLGFGESYMDGDWECERLDELIARLLVSRIHEKVKGVAALRWWIEVFRAKLINLQSEDRAYQVGQRHYDVGNDLFSKMLDSRMVYSCGYWEGATDLETAQQQKLELICQKLRLRPGERLLDIGCGWGGLAHYAAQHYGVQVHGVTISKEQQSHAQMVCAGLPVQIDLMDYRSLQGHYDKIVSVGMFEHVGPKNYPAYLGTVDRLLKDDGIFLLHTIGSDVTTNATDPWINKYIFPNGKIPSVKEIGQAVEGWFIVEDWHNFGLDYERTLLAWHENFVRSWPPLQHRYGDRFYRMWRYYLLGCAGYFKARQGQLWQVILTKPARREMYRSIRIGAGSY